MRIIDCDSHFLTCDIYKNIEEQYQKLLPRYIFDSENRVVDVQFDKDPCVIKDPSNIFHSHCRELGMNNLDIRIADFKKLKIDMQLLAPQERGMRFNYAVEKNLAAAMAHSYNIEIKKIVDQYPNKFFAVALVPLQDIDLALKEIEWIKENNFKAIYIDCVMYSDNQQIGGPISNEPRIDEFFDICEKYELIIYQHHFMHKIPSQGDDDINNILSENLNHRVKISIYDWITDGVFDRFPNLQVVITETAEQFIKSIFENLQEAYAESNLKCKKDPLFYFNNNIYITIEVENKDTVYYLLEQFGSERLLFNTDYPHIDSAGLNKWNDVDDLYKLELSQLDLENIAFRNAEKLFKI